MKNRIRHYRRQRQMTLKDLAECIGTTPQTVSRLETEVMTLSTDWLERLAEALSVHASELLDAPSKPDIPLLGILGANGEMIRAGDGDRIILDALASQPVAFRLAQAYGPYRMGEVLVGERLEGSSMANGLGRDCICCLPDGRLMLRRLIAGLAGRFTLVPLNTDEDVHYNQDLSWTARVVLRLEYI